MADQINAAGAAAEVFVGGIDEPDADVIINAGPAQ